MKDIHAKTESELNKLLLEKQAALRAFRFGLSGSKVRNVKEGRTLRREVAQILTELGGRGKVQSSQ